MIEVLHIDESRKDELKANLARDQTKIRNAVKQACKTLNKLTPDGALHAAGWIMTDLLRSLFEDEEQAIDLSKKIQACIESDLRIHARAARESLN
ncbi:hypothetical protein P9273_21515 [Mesorhizobium sp. WSM4935]|jgi:hypothetical protein|uniref:hypothetical protein n=1 Tax=Mesorhizobium sp. WSM4935 TaxID=3038547 RepID=UPI002415181D|nr:hypothetical protein [Mesorhizobium sp. WSM4935]MDG4877685.1 hypothetical protein [Mesorhizobium sp. WSM4935]